MPKTPLNHKHNLCGLPNRLLRPREGQKYILGDGGLGGGLLAVIFQNRNGQMPTHTYKAYLPPLQKPKFSLPVYPNLKVTHIYPAHLTPLQKPTQILTTLWPFTKYQNPSTFCLPVYPRSKILPTFSPFSAIPNIHSHLRCTFIYIPETHPHLACLFTAIQIPRAYLPPTLTLSI